jgi:RimJ/RimL family protein N-acetyltransferase
LGFIKEGHLRKNIYFSKQQDGTPLWQDTLIYGLLKEDRS